MFFVFFFPERWFVGHFSLLNVTYLFVPASEMVGPIDFSPYFVLDKGEFYLYLLFCFVFFGLFSVCVRWLTYTLRHIIDGVELQLLG